MGNAYCFVAMERNTKLVLAVHLGKRDKAATESFIGKLRYATSDSGDGGWYRRGSGQ